MYMPHGLNPRRDQSRPHLPAQAGAAVLAALILVGAVGVLSLALHYLSPLHDVAYQPHALTAGAGDVPLPPPRPSSTSSDPNTCAPPNDRNKEGQYCRCNKPDTKTVSGGSTGSASGGTTGSAASGATLGTVSEQCLPGCTYKVSPPKGGKPQVTPDSQTAVSKAGQLCKVMVCDSAGNNCSAATPLANNAGAPAALTYDAATAAQIANAADSGVAARIAEDYMGSGGDPNVLSAALAAQKAAIAGQPEMVKVNNNIDAIKPQIDALARQGSTQPAPTNTNPGLCTGSSFCLLGARDQTIGGSGAIVPTGDTANIYGCSPTDDACIKAGDKKQDAEQDAADGNVPPPRGGTPDLFRSGQSTFGGSSMGNISSFLSGLTRGLVGGSGLSSGSGIQAGNTIPQIPGTCNTQYLCNGSTLYYRNNQCVDSPMQYCQYGCKGSSCAQQNQSTQSTGQYGYGTDGQPCIQPPAQPSVSTCTAGTWKAVSATGNTCTTGWQCVPTTSSATTPVPSLSCQSQIADVGATFAISYACQNATASIGGGFYTMGRLSGSTTTVIAMPPTGTNTATYSLGCTNGTVTVGAQCSVQINNPQIALVANPNVVAAGATSTVGWVTSGMQSCVVSSPDLPDFTAQNASYTNVNGVTVTPILATSTRIALNCATLGGGTRLATTTIIVQ